jgi:hypothetical protein
MTRSTNRSTPGASAPYHPATVRNLAEDAVSAGASGPYRVINLADSITDRRYMPLDLRTCGWRLIFAR